MKRKSLIINHFLFLIIIAFTSCSRETEIYMWIAAERRICFEPEGLTEQLSCMYKLKESDIWSCLVPNIIGFDYEEGYEYLLLVKSGDHV